MNKLSEGGRTRVIHSLLLNHLIFNLPPLKLRKLKIELEITMFFQMFRTTTMCELFLHQN